MTLNSLALVRYLGPVEIICAVERKNKLIVNSRISTSTHRSPRRPTTENAFGSTSKESHGPHAKVISILAFSLVFRGITLERSLFRQIPQIFDVEYTRLFLVSRVRPSGEGVIFRITSGPRD